MSNKNRVRVDTTTGAYYSDPDDGDVTPLIDGAERIFQHGDGGGYFTFQSGGLKTVINFRYIVAIAREEVSDEPPF